MLEHYWPNAQRVNECIKNEAETADISVLLAVHQPTPLVKRAVGTGRETPTSEAELLDAFVAEDVPGGALLLPITGPSGVGKSHIIRWLDAQLQRSPEAHRLHIIRIPKSASLRRVVELILEPLRDNPDYEAVRQELSRAVAEVDVASAVVTFRAHLENALTAAGKQMAEDIRLDANKQHLRPLVGHARDLPRLFSDPALAQHFADKVLSRVINRALRGHRAEDIDDETLSQFVAEDLIIPDAVDLTQASQPVRQYYQATLAPADDAQRKRIVDLLNGVVDTAIGRVFQLEQTTSGITLQDIILAVRKMLLKDNKDLVLLVEDFAALAGIQDALLKVAIQEGVYEGKKVRATMRTAIALTDGYLAFRETILTRAQREWVIGGRQLSDEEILESVVGLVGSYLDAARWGGDELRRRFDQAPDIGGSDWLDPWRHEEREEGEAEALESFGWDRHKRSIFPFNRAAIKKLAERHLSENQRLVFNPRRVINEILRAPLLMRAAYERREFPPSDFNDIAANVFVARWVQSAQLAASERRRLASFLMVWGGGPDDEDAISHLPPSLFAPFSLPTPFELKRVAYVPETKDDRPQQQAREQEGDAAGDDEALVALRKKLDEWSGGAELLQVDARTIRKSLGLLLKGSINWGALRLREQDLHPNAIFIPNARGGAQGGLELRVCDDHTDETGTIRSGMLAAVRFENGGKTWDYPGGEDDYVAAMDLADHLATQWRLHLVAQAEVEIASLGQALITQARIGGLAPPVRVKEAETMNALLAPIAHMETKSEAWRGVVEQSLSPFVAGKPAREALQFELFARAGSFQGAGANVHALDGARVVAAMEAPPSEDATWRTPDLANYLRQISTNRLWTAVGAVVNELEQFKIEASVFTDEGFAKRAFVDDLQAIALFLSKTGGWHSSWLKLQDFERQLVDFQAAGAMDLVNRLERVTANKEREKLPTLLNELGRFEFGLIDQLVAFLKAANEVVRMATQASAQASHIGAQAKPEELASEILEMLRLVESDMFGASPP